jgi:serine/threonine protein kinase
MADRELEDAKKSEAGATPQRVKEAPGQAWTLRTAESDSDCGDSASNSGTSIESISDISDTGTHFGGAFRPENQLEADAIISGTYRIIQLIGKGGMGQVYLAEHMTLGKKCALKVMSAHQVTDKAWIRFRPYKL